MQEAVLQALVSTCAVPADSIILPLSAPLAYKMDRKGVVWVMFAYLMYVCVCVCVDRLLTGPGANVRTKLLSHKLMSFGLLHPVSFASSKGCLKEEGLHQVRQEVGG